MASTFTVLRTLLCHRLQPGFDPSMSRGSEMNVVSQTNITLHPGLWHWFIRKMKQVISLQKGILFDAAAGGVFKMRLKNKGGCCIQWAGTMSINVKGRLLCSGVVTRQPSCRVRSRFKGIEHATSHLIISSWQSI